MVKFEDSEEEEDRSWAPRKKDGGEKREKESSILGRVFNKSRTGPATGSSVPTVPRKIVDER